MNRQQRRISESFHKKEIKKQLANNEWTQFEDRTVEAKAKYPSTNLISFKANNLFSVQEFMIDGIRVAGIRRHDQSTNISWETKMRIKNEVIGEDVAAVEVYPRMINLVDQANMYWLWIIDCEHINLKNLKVNR